jgi:two-component sensor histidine kinase
MPRDNPRQRGRHPRRDGISRGGDDEIVNYRKNDEKFINAQKIGPVFDGDGRLIFRFGSRMDLSARSAEERSITDLRTAELLHRLKNIVNVMSVVIKMTGRSETDPEKFSQKVIQRLFALGQTHFDTPTNDRPRSLQFGQLVQTRLVAYAALGR